MSTQTRSFAVPSARTVILTGAAVFLTISYIPIPKWSELSGIQTQNWIAGPFVPLAYVMIFLLVISVATMGWATVLHRRSRQPLGKRWIAGLVTFLIVQLLNSMLIGADYDLAMNSDLFGPEVTVQNRHDWDFFYGVRSALFLVSAVITLTFCMLPKVIKIDPS